MSTTRRAKRAKSVSFAEPQHQIIPDADKEGASVQRTVQTATPFTSSPSSSVDPSNTPGDADNSIQYALSRQSQQKRQEDLKKKHREHTAEEGEALRAPLPLTYQNQNLPLMQGQAGEGSIIAGLLVNPWTRDPATCTPAAKRPRTMSVPTTRILGPGMERMESMLERLAESRRSREDETRKRVEMDKLEEAARGRNRE